MKLRTRVIDARIAGLWICLVLFLLRVVGQIEALLMEPDWLPQMQDWYSGLLPYPLLLPLQIVLLMIMGIVAAHETRGPTRARSRRARWQRIVQVFALLYFAAMLGRLFVQLSRGAADVLAAGGIPIMFHWVLALFLLFLSRPAAVQMNREDR